MTDESIFIANPWPRLPDDDPRKVELRELLRQGLAKRVGEHLDSDGQAVFLQLGARVVRAGRETLVDGYQACQGCWLVFETDDDQATLCPTCLTSTAS